MTDTMRGAISVRPDFRAVAKSVARCVPAPHRLFRQRDDLAAEIVRLRQASSVGRFLGDNDCEIETDASPDQLAAMLARIAKAWQAFGDSEPHWSVLTNDAFLQRNIGANLAAFYESGATDSDQAVAFLMRNRIDPSSVRRVVDYGCGVGRLTMALARRFPAAHGIDVSASHIAHARRYAADHGIGNVEFTRIVGLQDLDALDSIDFIYSRIVLQHNPPPVIAAILRMLFKSLAPGGCALFQVPTYYHGYRFACEDYLSRPAPQMEMNAIPQRVVFAIARDCGCDVLEVREDNGTGSDKMLSHMFLVQKADY
jgi:SAM-dependent methyltransferase